MRFHPHRRHGHRECPADCIPEFHEPFCGKRSPHGLRRRIFWWFGISILLTSAVTVAVIHGTSEAPGLWHRRGEGLHHLVSGYLAEVWQQPEARRQRVESLARELELGLAVEDNQGRLLDHAGPDCPPGARLSLPIRSQDRALGRVLMCWSQGGGVGGVYWGILAAALTLWAASSALAHRLARPLQEVVRVTQEIGLGKLSSRARLGRHHPGEVGELADAVNDMAVRIERQLSDQRELLATVSHEVRTPLGHLRVIAELLRDGGSDERLCGELEREILEIDALVGELLASSRLDFSALDRHRLKARELARRALGRAGLPESLLDDRSEGAELEGDATLLGRALGNLLHNAQTHGAGVARLGVRRQQDTVVFEVEDGGAGFTEQGLLRAFEPFYRGAAPAESSQEARRGASLGLGMALVQRIAVAHGGKSWAENRQEGGARVALQIPSRTCAPGEVGSL